MNETRKITRILVLIMAVSALIRGFMAGIMEFGYDEVYYWTYALFPDLSHFDHPPMVGWVIQLFSLNLLLDHEFFIRLAAVIAGTVNTWLIFKTGALIRDQRTGLYAAFLYNTSFYGFALCGLFILPDAPQSVFWLLTLYLLLRSLPDPDCSRPSRNTLFLAGLTAGLALLSKYHAVFLLSGAFIYILRYNRKWLTVRETWYAGILVLLAFTPVLLWNYENGFTSFLFHGSRTTTEGESWLHPEFLVVEIVGEIFYNNPVNFILIVTAFVALIRGGSFIRREYLNLILWISLPLIGVVLLFSLFARTLPHWTGPAYFGCILIASAWLSRPSEKKIRWKWFPVPIQAAVYLMLLLITFAFGQIRYGWLPLSKWGGRDFTYDLYGWRQLGNKFAPIVRFDRELLLIDAQAPILTFRWFPAANFDYYIGRITGQRVYVLSTLDRQHKYHWINKERGNLPIGMDAYYIALSDDYTDPQELYGDLFSVIQPSDTIEILRGKELVRKAFVYRLIGLKEELLFNPAGPADPANQEVNRLVYFQQQIRTNPAWLHVLEKRAREKKVTLETMIVLEAQSMLDREKEVRRDFRKLDSLASRSATDSIRRKLDFFPQ